MKVLKVSACLVGGLAAASLFNACPDGAPGRIIAVALGALAVFVAGILMGAAPETVVLAAQEAGARVSRESSWTRTVTETVSYTPGSDALDYCPRFPRSRSVPQLKADDPH